MKVALVHDWLTGMRGGEKVLEVLCLLFPDADIFTLVHARGSVSQTIESRRITTSFVQRLPMATRYYRRYLPLFPTAVELLNLDGYDLVISASHCVAKSVLVPGTARHVSYCFSPMRYAWDQFDEYFGPARVGAFASRWVYGPMLRRLARWDADTASRAHRFVAISRHVASRIRRYYDREAVVVYPPVDTTFYHPAPTPPGEHYLVVSALVPYKRVDRAIEGCARAGVPLRIVGDGPDRARLERFAGPSVRFLGSVSDDDVRSEYRAAKGVILSGEEDFGIVPLEAQACGRPVVALRKGGALETVRDGETGVFFDDPTSESLAHALEQLSSMSFDPDVARAHAGHFSLERHIGSLRAVIDETLAQPVGTRW
jgi:glycosyltransferase involved in cell wall biosynthesis